MMTDNTEPAQLSRWERLTDPVLDFIEDRVIDPIDHTVTTRVDRFRANADYRRVCRVRNRMERRAERTFSTMHRTRSRLLLACSSLESAVEQALVEVHQQHRTTRWHQDTEDAAGSWCCSGAVRSLRDSGDVLLMLSALEWNLERPGVLSSPYFGGVPERLKSRFERQLTQVVTAWLDLREREEAVRQLRGALESLVHHEAAEIVTRMYVVE